MQQQPRKVLFAKIEINGDREFSDILLSEDIKSFITPYAGKDLEISHIKDHGKYITGMFVATQKTDIPPIHKPGEDEDYSAVELEDGKGFAFPNVFLYCKDNKVLCYEVNRVGFSEKIITFFFNMYSEIKCDSDFSYNMGLVLNLDPVKRTNKLVKIDEVEIQIATPLNYIESQAGKNGTFSEIANISKNLNATKGIYLKIMATDEKGNRIDKKEVVKLLKGFISLPHSSRERLQDKMVIKGVTDNEDGVSVPDIINVMLNTLEGTFYIEKYRLAKNLQVPERRGGIEAVYKKFYKDIKLLV